MLFSKAALAAAVVTFMVFVDAKDVTCKKGKLTAKVTLNEGDSFSFRSVRGFLYAGRQRCRVNYELGSCAAASVSCSKFDLKADKICRTGDSITLNTKGKKPEKFCKTKGPQDVSFRKPFSVFFKSNKWQGGTFKCEVTCTAGIPPPSRIMFISAGNNFFSTVNLVNGEVCEIPSPYVGVGSTYSVAASFMESIGKPVVLRECDDIGSCGTFAFNGSGWELINQPITGNYSWQAMEAVVGDGQIWVSGLFGDKSFYETNIDPAYSSEIFDGSNWQEGPQFSSEYPFRACAVQINETSTMVIGGTNLTTRASLNNTYMFNFATGAWTESAPLNEAREEYGYGFCALLKDKGVLVGGGYNFGIDEYLSSVELFDFQQQTWVEQPPLFTSPKLLTWGSSVLAFQYFSTTVYKRADNGTWDPIEGVTLPFPFDDWVDKVFLLPEDYQVECTAQKKGSAYLKNKEDVQVRDQRRMSKKMEGLFED